ncbi:MAG: ion transporter [Sulfurimonadaceae bacterium]|nr:ion transporter [Sulfurimonadaceae bacterium]
MNPLSRTVIDAAYALQASARYRATKHFFYNLMENSDYRFKRYFDYMMMLLIFASIFILVREVKHHVNDGWLFFNNYVISIIFLIEYLFRMWVYSDSSKIIIEQYEKDLFLQREFRLASAIGNAVSKKFEYMRSIPAIIDLMAIMPFFHQLRLLRIFILFRVFKLFRYNQSLQNFTSVLSSKKFELLTLLIFVAIIMFVSAVLIYVMEANNPDSPIKTLFAAVYWSLVTISTVGYGDITPVSDAGRTVAMVIIISGIAVLSFSTSIVVSAFTEKLGEIKENKMLEDVRKNKNFYLICGYNEIGQQVASKLHRKGREVVILDEEPEHAKKAEEHGLKALPYDPAALESYFRLGIDLNSQVQAVLCLGEDDVQNVYTALTIRSMNKEVKLLSVLIEEQNRKKLQLAGVDEIVYTQELVGMTAREFSGKPVAFEAIHALRSEETGVHMDELVVDERTVQCVPHVSELGLAKYRLILMGIYKKELEQFWFNPAGSTLLEPGDIMLVVGEKSLIAEFNLSLRRKRV